MEKEMKLRQGFMQRMGSKGSKDGKYALDNG